MKALLPLVMLAACASAKQGETLTESIRSYNDGVRWERFAVAAIHLPPAQRSQFMDDQDTRAHDVKITDYDIVKVDQTTDKEAKVEIKLSWYKESEGTLHETQAMQTWERHGKMWLLVDEARVKGPEMPGLPEPLGRDDDVARPEGTSGTPRREASRAP